MEVRRVGQDASVRPLHRMGPVLQADLTTPIVPVAVRSHTFPKGHSLENLCRLIGCTVT